MNKKNNFKYNYSLFLIYKRKILKLYKKITKKNTKNNKKIYRKY